MEVRRITVDEAKRLLDTNPRTVFLDDRSPDAWSEATSKVRGAVRVPAAEVEGHVNEIPRGGPVVTYCT